MSLLSWLGAFVLIVLVYVIYMCWHYRLFYKQGIPMSSTPIPVFGTLFASLKRGPVAKYDLNKIGLTWGMFVCRTPYLVTCDTDIIRAVFIKGHATFPGNNSFTIGDELSDSMLSSVNDYDRWKYLRSVMSPAFSSGKLKRMMTQINKCAEQFRSHLIKGAEGNKSVEMRRFAESYTMDAIASTAFGLDINSEEDVDNEFVKHAKKSFEFSLKSPMFLFIFLFPFLTRVLGFFKISYFDRDVITFFTKVIRETMNARKDDTERVDFLQLMVNAHKEQPDPDVSEEGLKLEKPKRGMSEVEILAQGLVFFLGGYDTTATSLSFLAYCLACNPDKQDKLIEEVDSVLGGKDHVSDPDLQNMPYLDMCMNEALRLYPPAILVERCASKDVEIKGIKLPKNCQVLVPIYSMHRHEGFYPNPDAFIPERFSAEEKAARDPLLFMPFGGGPRKCVGQRLAQIEIKVAISHVLKTHRFVKAPETEIPIKFAWSALLKAENGVWLRLEKRENI